MSDTLELVADYPTIIAYVNELTPYPDNANAHPAQQVRQLGESLTTFRQFKPIVVWRCQKSEVLDTGVELHEGLLYLICGHGVWLAAMEAGRDWLEAKDITGISREMAEAILLADNAAPLGSEPIQDKLLALLGRTREMTADKPGLQGMLEALKLRAGVNGNGLPPKDAEPQIDKAAQLAEQWGTKLGQVWQLGNHRLAVGDCTDKTIVETVMMGNKANMVFTDPPYNVDYGSNQAPIWNKLARPIINDSLTDEEWAIFQDAYLKQTLSILEGAIYICMSNKSWASLRLAFEKAGGHWSSDIIWVKSQLIPGRKNYHSRHEPILYGWVEGKPHHWCGVTNRDDIWEIKRNSTNELHPTQKPIELIEQAIADSCPMVGLVYDPFCGSGSTIIASENLGRKCRAIELDPGYAAVSIQRWVDLTQQQPRLLTG